MARRRNLDAELVRRGLAEDKASAAELITSGRVLVSGSIADKPQRLVGPGEPVELAKPKSLWVSRGGDKLTGALANFDIDLADARVVDAGCSTGGFTDVVLDAGAGHVYAIDVGYGQIHERLRSHPDVTVMERTNIRSVTPETIGGVADAVVGDLSFVSLTGLAKGLVLLVKPGGHLVLLVKPQFEADEETVSKGRGVISDPAVWRSTTDSVIAAFAQAGATAVGEMESPIRGTEGNTEFLVHFVADANV